MIQPPCYRNILRMNFKFKSVLRSNLKGIKYEIMRQTTRQTNILWMFLPGVYIFQKNHILSPFRNYIFPPRQVPYRLGGNISFFPPLVTDFVIILPLVDFSLVPPFLSFFPFFPFFSFPFHHIFPENVKKYISLTFTLTRQTNISWMNLRIFL